MHQAQWSPERPLPPPVSLASQSHHEKPPDLKSSGSQECGPGPHLGTYQSSGSSAAWDEKLLYQALLMIIMEARV